MFLTPLQTNELLELIDVFSLKFAAHNISDEYLTDSERSLLEKYGVNPTNRFDYVGDAFRFGVLSQALGTKAAKKMSYDQLKRYVGSKQFVPLDTRELEALESVKNYAYNQIKGLGNKIKGNYLEVKIEADRIQRAEYEGVIRGSAEDAILNRKSLKQMASDIGHKTGDWARDLDRISDHVLHTAHTQGRAQQIIKQSGSKAQVYVHVFDQACKQCVKLFLKEGAGSEPKLFTLSQLEKIGTNVGRKVSEWKATLPPVHPYCRCELETIHEGATWDVDAQEFKLKQKEGEGLVKLNIES